MIIDTLIEYRKKKGHDITIVFDGWKSGEGKENKSMTGGITLVYSRIGDKADAVIKRTISSIRREWIVVTSDRDIADHAWASGSVPVSSEDFLNAIERKNMHRDIDDEEYDEEDDIYPRKGNPRKLSKKEKTVVRALSKL
jgi:predicted RNA-binding protein with PIN domain